MHIDYMHNCMNAYVHVCVDTCIHMYICGDCCAHKRVCMYDGVATNLCIDALMFDLVVMHRKYWLRCLIT